MSDLQDEINRARARIYAPPAPAKLPSATEPFECDHNLSAKTADYCKWGMRG